MLHEDARALGPAGATAVALIDEMGELELAQDKQAAIDAFIARIDAAIADGIADEVLRIVDTYGVLANLTKVSLEARMGLR